MDTENNSEKKIDKNFVETLILLEKNNIFYWICHGTLLGLIRDKDLIPWDHDVDIAVWYSEDIKKKIKSIMMNNNFSLKEKYLIEDDLLTFLKKGGREVDINFYHQKEINSEQTAYVKWFVPKNIVCKIIEALSLANRYKGKFYSIINNLSFIMPFFKKIKILLIKNNYFYKTIGYTQPINLLKDFKKVKYFKINVPVPVKSEEYLEFVYGTNWRNPVKKFNWIKDSPSVKKIKQ